jgi:hypothetical protein
MSTSGLRARPPTWKVLEQALSEKRAVRANYHGHDRLLCPHLLGWKNSRAKVLCYQSSTTTSESTLNSDPQKRWRLMFVDELECAVITDDEWQTATNYRPASTGIDIIELAVRLSTRQEPH